jgi:hypothetical protein
MKTQQEIEHETIMAQIQHPAGRRSATKGTWSVLHVERDPDGLLSRLPNRKQRRAAAAIARRAR